MKRLGNYVFAFVMGGLVVGIGVNAASSRTPKTPVCTPALVKAAGGADDPMAERLLCDQDEATMRSLAAMTRMRELGADEDTVASFAKQAHRAMRLAESR